MRHTNEMMLMIANFLYGECQAEAFSFDFPAALSQAYEAFFAENQELCEYLEADMPEVCGAFDPYGTGDDGTIGEREFREKVLAIYQGALPLSMKTAS